MNAAGRVLTIASFTLLLACTFLWPQDKAGEKTQPVKSSQEQSAAPTPNPRRAFKVGNGVSAPKIIDAPDPEYSEEARKHHREGQVVLEIVINEGGTVEDIRVTRSMGEGMDEKAIEAVRRWKFKPAMKDGHSVAVLINVEINFRLGK